MTRNKNCTRYFIFKCIFNSFYDISNTFTIVISVVSDKSYAWASVLNDDVMYCSYQGYPISIAVKHSEKKHGAEILAKLRVQDFGLIKCFSLHN